MLGGWLGVAKVLGWKRRHPWAAAGGLVLLAALLGWLGLWASRYFPARSHLKAAREAIARHQWSEAREQLEECLRIWPDDPEIHLLAARIARHQDRPDDAEEHLDRYRQLQGGDTQAVKVERALLRLRRGDLAGTEQFLRDCVAHDDPDAAEILDALASALMRDYRVPEAHQCLDELVRRQPDNFDALVLRATTARSQSWHTVAVESLQKALDLRPEAHEVRLSLARDLVSLGRYPEALKHLMYLREKQPDNLAVVFALARSLAGTGAKDRAVKLVDRLLAKDPNDWLLLSERGWLALELDRPKEAEDYLRRAHTGAPPDQTLLTRLADCLRLLGKHEEARRYREEADRLRADTLLALGLTKRIREKKPRNPAVYYGLARVLLRLGKPGDALHFFHKALDRDPYHRPTHQALATFYAKAGNSAKANYHRFRAGRADKEKGGQEDKEEGTR
jgi:predicted Zn-dependent protease